MAKKRSAKRLQGATTKQRQPASQELELLQAAEAKAKLEVIASLRSMLQLAADFFRCSKLCDCTVCRAINLKGRAKDLSELVVAALEQSMQRSSPLYLEAIRLRAECSASYPACATGDGHAIEPTAGPATSECRQIGILRSR